MVLRRYVAADSSLASSRSLLGAFIRVGWRCELRLLYKKFIIYMSIYAVHGKHICTLPLHISIYKFESSSTTYINDRHVAEKANHTLHLHKEGKSPYIIW
jgi:hypothetical protein